jgi:hypothetical protein
MSTNGNGEGKGDAASSSGAASAQAQAPKLRSGAHYAQWAADMEVWLERHGAQGVHSREITPTRWLALQQAVKQWEEEKLAAAMDALLGAELTATGSMTTHASASSVSASASGKLSDEDAAQRKLLRELVERSTRVYGVLYAALPEELRKQAESIPRGFAYGLWHWLQTKYQSTEQDHAAALLQEWMTLQQQDDESFDAYRARVDKLFSLLEAAKEPLSRRMYSVVLLDRLQPHYRQAVLALKAGGQLKDPKTVEWDTIVAFINTHEREENRSGTEGVAAVARGAWASAATAGKAAWQKSGEGETKAANFTKASSLDKVQCFSCGGYGHIGRFCNNRKEGASKHKRVQFGKTSGETVASAARQTNSKATTKVHGNSFTALSSDEEDDWNQSGEYCAHALTRVLGSHSYAMAARGGKARSDSGGPPEPDAKIAALEAKRAAAKAAAEAESEKKRDKRKRQKEQRSALTPEQRAQIEQARANKARRKTLQQLPLLNARRSFGLLLRSLRSRDACRTRCNHSHTHRWMRRLARTRGAQTPWRQSASAGTGTTSAAFASVPR